MYDSSRSNYLTRGIAFKNNNLARLVTDTVWELRNSVSLFFFWGSFQNIHLSPYGKTAGRENINLKRFSGGNKIFFRLFLHQCKITLLRVETCILRFKSTKIDCKAGHPWTGDQPISHSLWLTERVKTSFSDWKLVENSIFNFKIKITKNISTSQQGEPRRERWL